MASCNNEKNTTWLILCDLCFGWNADINIFLWTIVFTCYTATDYFNYTILLRLPLHLLIKRGRSINCSTVTVQGCCRIWFNMLFSHILWRFFFSLYSFAYDLLILASFKHYSDQFVFISTCLFLVYLIFSLLIFHFFTL